MVDQNRVAVDLIRDSSALLGVPVAVHHADALEFLTRAAPPEAPYDIIMVAPPYNLGLQQRAVDGITASNLLTLGGLVVVQRDVSEPEWKQGTGALSRGEVRTYGRTVFEFLEYGSPGGM